MDHNQESSQHLAPFKTRSQSLVAEFLIRYDRTNVESVWANLLILVSKEAYLQEGLIDSIIVHAHVCMPLVQNN